MVHAASVVTVTGKVTAVTVFAENHTTYSETEPGLLTLQMDELPFPCGGSVKRVIIRSTHASYQAALSIAMTAKARGVDVEVGYLDECTISARAWDFGYIRLAD